MSPKTPTSPSASFTSSSLKGLTQAARLADSTSTERARDCKNDRSPPAGAVTVKVSDFTRTWSMWLLSVLLFWRFACWLKLMLLKPVFDVFRGNLLYGFELCGAEGEVDEPEVVRHDDGGTHLRFTARWK